MERAVRSDGEGQATSHTRRAADTRSGLVVDLCEHALVHQDHDHHPRRSFFSGWSDLVPLSGGVQRERRRVGGIDCPFGNRCGDRGLHASLSRLGLRGSAQQRPTAQPRCAT